MKFAKEQLDRMQKVLASNESYAEKARAELLEKEKAAGIGTLVTEAWWRSRFAGYNPGAHGEQTASRQHQGIYRKLMRDAYFSIDDVTLRTELIRARNEAYAREAVVMGSQLFLRKAQWPFICDKYRKEARKWLWWLGAVWAISWLFHWATGMGTKGDSGHPDIWLIVTLGSVLFVFLWAEIMTIDLWRRNDEEMNKFHDQIVSFASERMLFSYNEWETGERDPVVDLFQSNQLLQEKPTLAELDTE